MGRAGRLTVIRRAEHGRDMESAPAKKTLNKGLLVKLAVGLVGLVIAALALLRGVDVRGAIDAALNYVRDAGPLAFFSAMAVLPAVGFPLSPFTLTAGSVFAPTLGWPVVLIATWLALAINVSLTYVLARWIARPWLEKLVRRIGYDWPHVRESDYWNITLLARLTPGPPFVMQGALLGLAGVPFRIYLIGSVLIAGAFATVFAVFGEALLAGKGRVVLIAIGVMAVLGLGMKLLRRHLARKKAALAHSTQPEI